MMINTLIFDWKRTLYDPDSDTLLPGVMKLLSSLEQNHLSLFLVGKGGADMYAAVKRLEVEKFFTRVVFKEGAKEASLFEDCLSDDPKETIFIGDRVRSELEVGNKLGAVTVWFKQGKFAEEEPENEMQEPTYTVTTMDELIELLQSRVNAAEGFGD